MTRRGKGRGIPSKERTSVCAGGTFSGEGSAQAGGTGSESSTNAVSAGSSCHVLRLLCGLQMFEVAAKPGENSCSPVGCDGNVIEA